MARKASQARSSQGRHVSSASSGAPPPAARPVPLEIYDTTLRDGAQAEDVTFSAEDKVRVAQQLDGLGVQFIEGGWPGANPKDIEFFRMIKTIPLQTATMVSFGSRVISAPLASWASIRHTCSVKPDLLMSGPPTA